jgi:hypothetical protein
MKMIATKYFTPSEAELTLPLVRKIVRDILDTTREMRLFTNDLGGVVPESDRIRQMSRNIEGFMGELEELGCYYKDWDFIIGLVDFPAVINGREVFLCWRSDEEKIKFYHGVEEGFSGRKLIPEDYFKN